MANDNSKKIDIEIDAHTTKATNEIKSLNKQIDSLSKQSTKTDKSLTQTNKSITKMGASFETLGQHLTRLLVIYGSISTVTNTVTAFADFEQSMVNLGAISGATADELVLLEDKAIQLGESTVFSASQVAEAMTEMARSGLTVQQQLDGIAPVLNLSVNGMVSLKDASRIATESMNAFGLESTDTLKIVDVMSKGINTSAVTLPQLSSALSNVSSVAKDTGLSLEETVATLGALGDAGRRGGDAGTHLKIALLRLSSNPEAQKYIDELGIKLTDTTGHMLPFTDQLRLIKTALDKVPLAMQRTYKAKIFGTEVIGSMNIILDSIDKIDTKTAELSESFGYAQNNSAIMIDTLQGSYKELLSAIEGLQIKIGNELSPALRNIVEDATLFIRTLSNDDIALFSEKVANLVTFIAKLGSTIGDMFGQVIDLTKGFSDMSGEFVLLIAIIIKFRKALISLGTAHPVIATLTVALGALSAQYLTIQKNLEGMDEQVASLDKQMSDFTGTVNYLSKNADKFSSKQISDGLGLIQQEVRIAENSIEDYKKKIKELTVVVNESRFIETTREQNEIIMLTNSIKVLEDQIHTASLAKGILENAGDSLNQKRIEEIALINKTKNATDKLTNSARELKAKELEAVESSKQGYEKRVKSAETALGSLKNKERKLVDDLKKLELELANTRKKHSDDRLDFNNDFQSKLADLRASSFTELAQYNDAQLRADKSLSLAKEAISNGEFAQAKEYFKEYERLIQVNATNEIKQGENVVRTKKQGINELIRDTQKGHDVAKALLEEEQRLEIKAIEDKKALKQSELAIQQLQIKLQIQSIKLLAELVSGITGVNYDEMLTKFNEKAKGIEDSISAITKQQRAITITGNLDGSKAEAELDSLKTKGDNLQVTTKADTDTKEASSTLQIWKSDIANEDNVLIPIDTDMSKPNEKFTKFEVGVRDRTIIANMDVNTEDIENKAENVKLEIERTPIVEKLTIDAYEAISTASDVKKGIESTPIIPTMGLNTAPVISANREIEKLLSKPITKHVYVVTHNTQARQNGGLIHSDIPKFQDGGFINRHGFLGGYGGGDKVKALLEAGEFIVKKEAVRSLGLAKLHEINNGNIPKYQTGGLVGGSNSNASTPSKTVNINLNVGGKTYSMVSDEDVANSLARHLLTVEV